MKNWKSSLLEKLKVSAITSSDSGPSGLAKGLLLAVTVAVSLGAMTQNAYADPVKRDAPSGFVKAFKMVAHADDMILDPVREKALETLVGKNFADNLNETAEKNAEFGKSSLGWQVFDIAATALGVTAAAPVVGTWMVLKQIDSTYEFIEDRKFKNINLRMSEVQARTDRIYNEESDKIRLAQIEKGYIFADSKSPSDLDQTNEKVASADLPSSSASLDELFPKEGPKEDKDMEYSR